MVIPGPVAIPLAVPGAAAGVKPEVLDKSHSDLKKATQQFEAYFVDTLLKEMRKTIPKDTLIGDSDHQQEIFQDMMDQTVADTASRRGSFGIAEMMYRELSLGLPPNTSTPAPSLEGRAGGPVSLGDVLTKDPNVSRR